MHFGSVVVTGKTFSFYLWFSGFGTFVVSSGEPHSDAHFGHSTNVLVFVSSRKRHLRSLNPTAAGICTTFTRVHVHLNVNIKYIYRELTYMYTRHERVMHTWHAPASSGCSCFSLTYGWRHHKSILRYWTFKLLLHAKRWLIFLQLCIR